MIEMIHTVGNEAEVRLLGRFPSNLASDLC